MSTLRAAVFASALVTSPALAAETIGAMGAEKCGRAVTADTVDFLAPEDVQVEARVKALVGGSDDQRRTAGLSVDGKDCSGGRCAFRAAKGQTYKLAAKSTGKVDDLCISVSRP